MLLYDNPLPMALSLPTTTTIQLPTVIAATIAKNGPTSILGGFASNPSTTTWAFLHCYDLNTTTAFTLGQTTNLKTVIHIPIGGTWENDWIRPRGPFTTGMLLTATTDLLGTTPVTTAVRVSLDLT